MLFLQLTHLGDRVLPCEYFLGGSRQHCDEPPLLFTEVEATPPCSLVLLILSMPGGGKSVLGISPFLDLLFPLSHAPCRVLLRPCDAVLVVPVYVDAVTVLVGVLFNKLKRVVKTQEKPQVGGGALC